MDDFEPTQPIEDNTHTVEPETQDGLQNQDIDSTSNHDRESKHSDDEQTLKPK